MKDVKKFFKLLCFVFIMFFMIGIGGVSAQNVTVSSVYRINNEQIPSAYFYAHKTSGGYYAFCMNSNRWSTIQIGDNVLMYPTDVYSGKYSKIKNIILFAIQNYNFRFDSISHDRNYSFTSGNTTYNLKEYEVYGVIQMAIWNNAIGKDVQGGYTKGYQYWVGHSNARKALFNILTTSNVGDYSSDSSYSVQAKSNGVPTMTDDGEYLVSNEYTIKTEGIPSGTPLTVSSSDSEIYYNDRWSNSATVNSGDKIKVRVKIPEGQSAGSLTGNVTITSGSFLYDYDLNFYSSGINNVQDMAVLTPKTRTVSGSFKVTGNYEHETLVNVQKVDSKTGGKIAGAKLGIYKEDGTPVKEDIISTAQSSDNEQISLGAGKYYLSEIEAPDGYDLDADAKVEFEVTSALKVVDKDGNVIESATITFTDDRQKVKVRKVDENGNPIEGVRIEIGSISSVTASCTSIGECPLDEYVVACGITDSQGYLTKPCTESGYTNFSNSDGKYDLTRDGMYYVKESNFKDGYYNRVFDDYGIDYSFSKLRFSSSVRNIKYYESTLTLEISNDRYIDVSKVDITSGQEIAGAELRVYGKTDYTWFNENYSEMTEIDSWTSEEGKTHRIEGIIVNHRYILSETLAPEGYFRITSNIEFEMDENGKVTTYDAEGKSLVLTDSNGNNLNTEDYKLVVPNDYTKTVFSKVSAVADGEEIAGAQLKVCTKASYDAAKEATGDGNNCEAFVHPFTKEKVEWVSEAGKSKVVEALPAGSYYLVEELAPEGYVKQVNSVDFIVKDDGTITPVKMVNEPTKVVISKKDITSGDEIPGATIKICTLASYETDGADCKPDKDEWAWTSGTEPKEIDLLPLGDYVLIETLPAPDYQEGMIIDGDLMTAYKFSITADDYNIKIDVYNQLLTHVPKTGISTLNLFAIGGLMVFVGYETIKIYRKRVNA